MSTTLTNGLKLPDKGSVDWYADMQNNYAILDGAVGTIAAHTSALAGKAPAVHTHTKSDITDFPAYGTTAGTICEGNDSRLSDARTPVAHTHGNVTNDGKLATASKVVISDSNKNITTSSVSDTELGYLSGVTSSVQTQLNGKAASNHVHGNISNDGKVGTTANKPLITGGGGRVMTGAFGNAANTFCEGNDSRLSDARTPVAHTHTKSDVTDLLNSNFIPSANNSYDLGSSSYQWNNLYAKNYYYNGVAWGLDKYNIWTNSQAYKLTGTEVGSTTSGYISLSFTDKNNANLGLQRASVYSDGRTCFSWKIYNTDNNSQSISSSLEYYITKTEVKVFAPVENGEVNLGTSTNKWKTLNGINPGALSLPDISDADPIYTNNWVGDNSSSNQYTPTENGWIYFRVEGANKNITIRYGGAGGDAPSITSESTLSHVSVFFPVRSGVTMYIFFNGTMVKAFFYPCLGNV